MKQKVIKIIKHPLIYGSSIVVIGNLSANFFNFLFNVFMTRNLSNADYGVLASIISVISFPALIAAATIPLVINFAGTFFAQGKLDMARAFYYKIMKFFFILSLFLFVSFLLFIPSLSNFLHINDTPLLIMTSFIIFLGIISVINTAFIQAKLAFGSQVMVSMVGAIAKLGIGVPAVLLGFMVSGAVGAIFLSAILAYIVSFIPLKFIFQKNLKKPKVSVSTRELLNYGIPSMLTWIGLTSLISIDILLVKHYFDPTSAGIYAGMALIGKVIYYVSSPIGSVMFPMVVQKYSNNESFSSTFKLSLVLVFTPSVILTVLYFLFPDPAILFFTKKTENLVVSPLLGLFGIFMSLYTLLFIIANFYLSIKKTKIYIPVLLGAAAQIVLILMYHETFLQIISISVGVTAVLVIGLIQYYYFKIRKTN